MEFRKRVRNLSASRFYCGATIIVFLLGISPVILNVLVDPYEIANVVDMGLIKKNISEKSHYPLWKIAHYPAERADLLILGDSRARSLRDKYWHELGVSNAYNFAYGGATISEIYDTFNYVKHNKSIKTFVVGIQLRSFDPLHKNGLNRVPEAIRLNESPLAYYSNWFVSRIGLKILWKHFRLEPNLFTAHTGTFVTSAHASETKALSYISTLHAKDSNKDDDKEACKRCMLPENVAPSALPTARTTNFHHYSHGLGIWSGLWRPINVNRNLKGKYKRQVRKNAKSDWRSFNFSETYWKKIVEISDWCKSNNVNLIFVIPPTIIEMQNRIVEFGFGELNHNFRLRLAKLGPVVDFDFDNSLTRNLKLFTDAYHSNYKAAKLIVGEIVQLASYDRRVIAKARKRRGMIICPLNDSDVTNRTSDKKLEVIEGQSCRIWRMKNE